MNQINNLTDSMLKYNILFVFFSGKLDLIPDCSK